ncbi:UNVERIFIED_CONTAM: hypothetical protein Slati_0412100, partial [Sesamum latifolium]
DELLEKEDSSDTDDCMSIITFTDEDLLLGSKPHNRPLFVAGYVREQKVNMILIDGGSTVNILPLRILKELGISIDELSNSRLMIQGFNQGGQRAGHYKAATDYGGHVKKVLGDNKPFTEAESHFADTKYYIEGAKKEKEVLPSEEPKSYTGYNPKEKLSLGKLPPEATGKKLHGLNATQIMLKEKGHAIQDSRVGLGFTPPKPVRIAIRRVSINYVIERFSSTEDDKEKENPRESTFNRLGLHRKTLHGLDNK